MRTLMPISLQFEQRLEVLQHEDDLNEIVQVKKTS
jgi:hypothetical protein